jgi:DNA invertase Pin-like site-specific DNA recombinase
LDDSIGNSTPRAKVRFDSDCYGTLREIDRTAFQSMFKDASQRKFDVLIFWALDRLSREGVLETLRHLNRLTSYGVGTEQYFNSCWIFKDAVIAIIATVASQERVRISLRVRAGLELARASGKRIGRPPLTQPSMETRNAIAGCYANEKPVFGL